ISLTKLANSNVQLQPSPPRLNPLGTTRVVLIIMAVYLLSYTLFGLTVIIFSSPAQFQGRRPGRLILRKDSLIWRGPAGQGSLMDALEWIRQDAHSVGMRVWRRTGELFGRAQPAHAQVQAREQAIGLAEIKSAIAIDRRAFGYLLRDFSSTLLE